MKFVTVCFISLVAAIGAGESAAQSRPNFSGVWVSVGAQTPRELNVKQDSSTLTFDGGADYKSTFNLDGSETKINAPDGKPLLQKAAWDGGKLVVTIHNPETKQDIRRVIWALDSDGQLVTEIHALGPAAVTRSGQPSPPIKEVFKRR